MKPALSIPVLIALILCVPSWAFLQVPSSPPGLESLSFLVGEWVGDGGGTGPGQGTGTFTYAYDLDGKILVRKNLANYPATRDRPAYTHNDLLITYPGPSNSLKAVYFDNEGHVINYTVSISLDRSRITFLSDIVPSAPRFRLAYTKVSATELKILFEIAPPGKPDEFAPYIEAKAKRR